MADAVTFVYCPRLEVNVHAHRTLSYGKMERPVIINTVGQTSLRGINYYFYPFTLTCTSTIIIGTAKEDFKILSDCWDYHCLCDSESISV